MRWLRRRETVPPEVRTAVVMADGERALAVCRSGEVGYLVASDRALHVVSPPESERIPWDLIDRARWEPPVLTVVARAVADAPVETREFVAAPESDVPSVVRERVNRSILINSRIDVPGGHARVLARRSSDTGEIRWSIDYGRGVDPDDPAVRLRADGELADLRSRLGV